MCFETNKANREFGNSMLTVYAPLSYRNDKGVHSCTRLGNSKLGLGDARKGRDWYFHQAD